MRHKTTKAPGYYVVYKLGEKEVFLKAHWDGRPAKKTKRIPTARDGFKVSPAQLQQLGVHEGEPPYKVRVTPLGEIVALKRD